MLRISRIGQSYAEICCSLSSRETVSATLDSREMFLNWQRLRSIQTKIVLCFLDTVDTRDDIRRDGSSPVQKPVKLTDHRETKKTARANEAKKKYLRFLQPGEPVQMHENRSLMSMDR